MAGRSSLAGSPNSTTSIWTRATSAESSTCDRRSDEPTNAVVAPDVVVRHASGIQLRSQAGPPQPPLEPPKPGYSYRWVPEAKRCPICNGHGTWLDVGPGKSGDWRQCSECDGSGKLLAYRLETVATSSLRADSLGCSVLALGALLVVALATNIARAD